MKDFAMQLTQKCVSMGLLDESYSEWFAYSIEKRVTTLFTWLVQCLIGGFCFGWTLTISFSVFFLLIRKYTNGYHAATYSKCLFCSILLEVVLLASISYVFRTGLALLFLTIVSDITILYIAPVNNKSIHWSTNEFKAAKIAVRWLLLILNIFAILLVGTQIAPSILQGLVAALTADAITISISRCQNRKEGIQMKIQVKQFAKKKIEALVKKDMQEWPPGCAGWMYQPKRPYVPEKHLQEKRK